MIHDRRGNLLEAEVEALVNTVNTVGVMGKGIALMFKEQFPANYKSYEAACKRGEVEVGRMFVTATGELYGPHWIINFPTKKHWRHPSKLQWIVDGLQDLRTVIETRGIQSIAIPPLGCGNGGLDWADVRPMIVKALADLPDVEVFIYGPTLEYQNASKENGVENLTPARAMMAEMIRRYGSIAFHCSILEAQKLGWILNRTIDRVQKPNPLNFQFSADIYGPNSDRLRHLLNQLDGSFLHCDKRLADASPSDAIHFEFSRREQLNEYFRTPEGKECVEFVDKADHLIDGFQTPLGMELLATVDWLLANEGTEPSLGGVRAALERWPAGDDAARRKQRIFSDTLIQAALERLKPLAGSE